MKSLQSLALFKREIKRIYKLFEIAKDLGMEQLCHALFNDQDRKDDVDDVESSILEDSEFKEVSTINKGLDHPFDKISDKHIFIDKGIWFTIPPRKSFV